MRYIDRAAMGDRLNWTGVITALREGHSRPKAKIADQFLTRGQDTLLSRAAWIDGLGIGVKSVSVMAGNMAQGLPTVQGAMLVFEDETGRLDAIVDSDLVTEWKTAGDSVLGAKLLARPEAKRYLIIGAGVVAASLVRAYSEIFPDLEQIEIWNRTGDKALQLAQTMSEQGFRVRAAPDLEAACRTADIISTATMSNLPVLQGDWVTPGTHVDLIGAFKADMREADDALMRMGSLFVDSFDTTVEHIGELMIPIAEGTITPDDIKGDLAALCQGRTGRNASDEITIFKNGGGAHLDLMTARYILSVAD